MLVLIVADNEFNAYCLTRLIEATCNTVQVTMANGSFAALQEMAESKPDLVVLDGDLGVGEGRYCSAPVLADLLWRKFPHISVIAWTDCDEMRLAFAEVFKQHNKQFNEQSIWPKIVYPQHLQRALKGRPSFAEFVDYGIPVISRSGHLYN
ncbi:response regulator [Legionella londiniensis]|uniref:Two component sensor and regulator histidine kinase response regulator n=1 Tax=Legionella londiniensis TaxID=45068 RepID=A0A0W0VJB7_9GAMM|nr:response regulator [Legionella londiniensis]KTD20186.1 two component sensor and regulator histidine kinase response regulator [Legionella londiniensis]STX94353.1 two component sensor and regulator, histidine kinase response regulator [Legionella londiniensis]